MKRIKNLIWIFTIGILMFITSYASYRLAFRKLIFPKVSVAGISVGGMDKVTALKLVEKYFVTNPSVVILRINEKEISKFNEIRVERDINWAVEQAFMVGRNGNLLTQLSEQIDTLFSSRSIAVPISYDKEDLVSYVDQMALDYNQKPVWPKLVLEEKQVKVMSGKDGLEIVKHELINKIAEGWSFPDKQIIDVPRETVSANENVELTSQAVFSLNKWGERTLVLKHNNFESSLKKEEMMALFGLTRDIIDIDQFETLLAKIQQQVETEPKDAVFQFEDGKVKEFKPEVIGAVIDIPVFKDKLAETLVAAENEVLEIPVILSYPKIKAGDVNNLGIRELIGEGKSSFSHSIPGRVFNVNLAASRINSTIVAPGEEFSFNSAVGDISKSSGYQSAYIISGGKTVLGDGGGVCQVSTTVFRAALNSGLPITERKAHAYRVSYYEQDSKPGIDATVYNPTVDLKFLNDTGNHILVQTKVDTKNLKMEVKIYGTKDGRVVSISEPKISSQSAPPATMYVDDPTLPLGQMKQIDWSAWGAKVSFNYKVTKGTETVFEKTFYSNYQPWQAIYLKGTKI
ncbi:MAG TPA: VanW family protein [Spirochaetia bacterium]|nr:VanW family protein [Spirochaetia bacterium]